MCCRSGCFSAGTAPLRLQGRQHGPPDRGVRLQMRQHGPLNRVFGLGAAPPAAHPAGPVPVGPFSGTWAAELEICDVHRVVLLWEFVFALSHCWPFELWRFTAVLEPLYCGICFVGRSVGRFLVLGESEARSCSSFDILWSKCTASCTACARVTGLHPRTWLFNGSLNIARKK
jgi:hypothetical protein